MLRASCPAVCPNGLRNSANGWKTHNLPGQPGSVLSHGRKVFPAVQREPPVFHIVLVTSGPVTGHHWKEPNSIFLVPSPQVFIDIDEIPLSWVYCRLRSSISLSLYSKERCSSPLNFVALCWIIQYVYFPLILGSPKLDPTLLLGPHRCWSFWHRPFSKNLW